MQILQIKKSRSNDQVWLTFDDGSYLPFKIDDVVLEKLKINQEVDFNRLCELSLKFLLNNYALRQIAISPKIGAIILPKLKNQARYYIKKYLPAGRQVILNTDQIITEIINYLENNNWLDKVAYAKFLIKKHYKKSKRYLEQLFSFYHLDKNLLINNDKDNLKTLLLKKVTKLPNPLDFKTKNKLIQSLLQKGFAYSDIKSVIDEVLTIR